MRQICTTLLLTVLVLSAHAQNSLSEQDAFINKKALYLKFQNNSLSYFTGQSTDEFEPLGSKYNFSLKFTHSNIFVSWVNPLRYRISWKDSVLNDERDEAVISFFKLVTTQFGLQSNKNSNKAANIDDVNIGDVTLTFPASGINSLELLEIALKIKDAGNEKPPKFSELELNNIKRAFAIMIELDTKNAIPVKQNAINCFNSLYNVKEYSQVKDSTKAARKILDNINVHDKVIELHKNLLPLLKEIEVEKDKLLADYLRKAMLNFSENVVSTSEKNQEVCKNLEILIQKFENSTVDLDSKNPGYFYNRGINFEIGKKVETTVTVTEYELNKEKSDVTKKGDVYVSKLKFRKSDRVIPSVGAGIFYSGVTFKSFGVKPNDAGTFEVTEDNIESGKAVTATFLNLTLNCGSRYAAPLLQFGVDPTKKHPYFLSGGGISIPVADIALTGGLVWSWNPTLEKLSVGSNVNSSTDLEKDITYKFDWEPKGYYFGIQYNF